MGKLTDKVAVITGGSGNIGLATAKLFLSEGAKVVIADLNQQSIDEAVSSLNTTDVAGIVCDVTKPEDNANLVRFTVEKFGKVDIFFANAGIEGIVAPLEEYPIDMFDKVYSVNVKGVFYGLKYAFPAMEKSGGGSFIITSSVAGLSGTPNVIGYVTSKHATLGLMRTAALEGAPKGIRVNTIHPAPVDNRMMRSLEEGFAPGQGEAAKQGFEQAIPLKRYATNEEIANLALFLASDDSSYITGSTNVIDGGMNA